VRPDSVVLSSPSVARLLSDAELPHQLDSRAPLGEEYLGFPQHGDNLFRCDLFLLHFLPPCHLSQEYNSHSGPIFFWGGRRASISSQ